MEYGMIPIIFIYLLHYNCMAFVPQSTPHFFTLSP